MSPMPFCGRVRKCMRLVVLWLVNFAWRWPSIKVDGTADKEKTQDRTNVINIEIKQDPRRELGKLGHKII